MRWVCLAPLPPPAEVPQFRRFVADLMMSWAQIKMAEPQLVKEVYSLLYRQYNGAHEVGGAHGRGLQWWGHMGQVRWVGHMGGVYSGWAIWDK